MLGSLFTELSLVIILAVIISAIFKLLKQPLIIAYIITGIIVGPNLLGVTPPLPQMETFAHIGISLLHFLVGLNLNPKNAKDVGKVSIITGISQVLFTSIIGFALGKLFGFSNIASLYIAIAVSFSSTIIIMKLLSDKRDVESQYGRIAVGFLIV